MYTMRSSPFVVAILLFASAPCVWACDHADPEIHPEPDHVSASPADGEKVPPTERSGAPGGSGDTTPDTDESSGDAERNTSVNTEKTDPDSSPADTEGAGEAPIDRATQPHAEPTQAEGSAEPRRTPDEQRRVDEVRQRAKSFFQKHGIHSLGKPSRRPVEASDKGLGLKGEDIPAMGSSKKNLGGDDA